MYLRIMSFARTNGIRIGRKNYWISILYGYPGNRISILYGYPGTGYLFSMVTPGTDRQCWCVSVNDKQ